MVRIRRFELALADLFQDMRRRIAAAGGDRLRVFDDPIASAEAELQGNLESAVGQEPVAAGILHLRADDYLGSTHRSHHVALAKGVSLRRLVAELFGRVDGTNRGKGGDFSLHDTTVNFETSVIMAQLLPVAAGHALAAQTQGRDAVAMVCLGEGASNQGTFHEALNLASLWKLPVVFVVENNGYALSVPVASSAAVPRIAERAVGYGLPGVHVAGNDPMAISAAAAAAISRARAGEGPTLLEVETDRIRGGFEGDRQQYRDAAELDAVRQRDALMRFERELLDAGALDEQRRHAIQDAVDAEIADAFAFARDSPYPPVQDAARHVFVESRSPVAAGSAR
ncbi:thiamine pyrophosphate-dependent dehydrogenase E1 component subunit alpha [Conexibacter sp. CPCC 206217]|uniref:thiamine pyrophosphate-dependent dehydrogenase E1 component subunit alpha n=1 Tax=Conexibacter sp. CPCC 206217 TaxID=3064574 RepID=UPI00271824F8|nr:thiamine pyrophosphate-dependent dehydrogenase E1 component subunit alpha [Conexibacter sp. CPCC 206217]MDO8210184.1 thiamine pyrophosphate-dependent dehydrogenase E1 component subunit alpha [Conexibacter sp. CPCC 206217]